MEPAIDAANVEHEIKATKACRKYIQFAADAVALLSRTRPTSIAVTKIEEARMWLGKHLETLGRQYPEFLKNPYPDGSDPTSNFINPPSDIPTQKDADPEQTNPRDFGWALHRLKAGDRVRRSEWIGVWLAMQTPTPDSLISIPYIYIEHQTGHPAFPYGGRVPWQASHKDLLAEDWYIVKDREDRPQGTVPPEHNRKPAIATRASG